MLRAGVPEATVNEDGNPLPGEDNVRSHPAFRQIDPQITAITVSGPVEGRAQGKLRFRIPAPVCLHVAAAAST